MTDATKQESIPRAKETMDPEAFRELLALCLKNPWLRRKSDELIFTWNSLETSKQKALLSDLIARFCVVDSFGQEEVGAKIANKVCDDLKLLPKSTCFVAVSDDSNADGSQAFLQMIKNKFPSEEGWSEGNFINNVKESVQHIADGSCLLLLDDFIGTAKTIIRKYNWFLEKAKEKKIKNCRFIVVSAAGMEDGIANLNALDIEYICPFLLKKGISQHYTGTDLSEKIDIMMEIEGNLSPKYKGWFLPKFGYGKSESLFCFQGWNCPNNVFPVFWWPRDSKELERKTLLRRLR